MYAKYNDIIYKMINNSRKTEILTKQNQKSDLSFLQDRDWFYKNISIDEQKLTDIFELDFIVLYDSHLETVPTTWKVDIHRINCENQLIKLIFCPGLLPGWEHEDQYTSKTYISFNDILGVKLKTKYIKKDGVILDEPLVEEKPISINEMIEIHNTFKYSNI